MVSGIKINILRFNRLKLASIDPPAASVRPDALMFWDGPSGTGRASLMDVQMKTSKLTGLMCDTNQGKRVKTVSTIGRFSPGSS